MCLSNSTPKKPKQQQDGSSSSHSSSSSTGNWHLIDLDFKKEPKARATLHSILAESIRPNARLAHSHELSPACRCGCVREDVQHVFEACEDHRSIRQTYDNAMCQETSRDAETRQQLQQLVASPTFQTCGFLPARPEMVAWHDQKAEDEGDAAQIPELSTFSAQQR